MTICAVPIDNRQLFGVRPKRANDPKTSDVVRPKDAKWVVMFGIQKPVNIVLGKRGIHDKSWRNRSVLSRKSRSAEKSCKSRFRLLKMASFPNALRIFSAIFLGASRRSNNSVPEGAIDFNGSMFVQKTGRRYAAASSSGRPKPSCLEGKRIP